MKNKELKQRLIKDGTVKMYRETRRANAEMCTFDLFEMAMKDDDLRRILFGDITIDELQECERIRRNCYQQYRKIADHIRFLFNGNWTLYFFTFTISPDALEKVSEKTFRETISRLLTKFCDDYILNIDYGDENERLHYHAIGSVIDPKYKGVYKAPKKGYFCFPFFDENYKYGFYSAELCRITNDDNKRLAWYMNKLTLHSIKIKQTYVSTKKGSPYQKYKKLVQEQKRQARSEGRLFMMNFDERETDLLSGFSAD